MFTVFDSLGIALINMTKVTKCLAGLLTVSLSMLQVLHFHNTLSFRAGLISKMEPWLLSAYMRSQYWNLKFTTAAHLFQSLGRLSVQWLSKDYSCAARTCQSIQQRRVLFCSSQHVICVPKARRAYSETRGARECFLANRVLAELLFKCL